MDLSSIQEHALATALLFSGAYLGGSISSAILVCRLFGLPDPRTEGSHNPGATNVMRLGGKPAAALTLAGDVLKGVIPVLIAHQLDLGLMIAALAGFFAFLGHLLPVFFQFRGGKGVATAFGLLFALYWPLGVATGACWLLVFGCRVFRQVSAILVRVYCSRWPYGVGHSRGLTGDSHQYSGHRRAPDGPSAGRGLSNSGYRNPVGGFSYLFG